jgi:cell division septum initiation protein DivIVA
MAQQISVEDAFPTFQKRCRELFEENLILRAQVDVLERKLAEAQQAPAPTGPDLAALHPPMDDQRD